MHCSSLCKEHIFPTILPAGEEELSDLSLAFMCWENPRRSGLFFPDFCHLQKHNRDDMKHFLFCWFIIGGWGYCHCHGFLTSDNLGWSQNKEIPDHLWFSRHMKSRLKNCIEQVWFVFPNFDSPIQSLVVISGCTSHWLRKWTSYRFLLLAQRCMA